MKCEMRSKWFYQFNSSVDWFEVSELDLLAESIHLMSFDNWPNWIKCQTVERDLNWVKLNETGGKWIQLTDQVISKMFLSRFLTRLKHLGTIRWFLWPRHYPQWRWWNQRHQIEVNGIELRPSETFICWRWTLLLFATGHWLIHVLHPRFADTKLSRFVCVVLKITGYLTRKRNDR